MTSEIATVLLVDDEANILSSLKRLLRPEGYRLLTAESGDEALKVLETEAVDLVVSDMRMPGMTGAQLLEAVCQRYPDTVRILLTGYADISSTIDAINLGQIYRYVAKPWNDNELRLLLRDALERRRLRLENEAFARTIAEQNEKLRQFNTELEAKVVARTQALSAALEATDKAHRDLKQSYTSTIRIFCDLIDMRADRLQGHGRRVADLARNIGRRLGVSDIDQQTLVFAGLLHDLGKLGVADDVLLKPFSQLKGEERGALMAHPVRAESLLMGVPPLRDAARIIRGHHENFDGTGYPDGVSGLEIPLLTRILAVANAFDALQLGTMVGQTLSPKAALEFIELSRGKRFDPEVVDAFVALGITRPPEDLRIEHRLGVAQLRPGMVLAQDLRHADGYLLLSKGHLIDKQIIDQLIRLENSDGRKVIVQIAHTPDDQPPGRMR